MTTIFQFNPSNKGVPTFMPTFDGAQYIITVLWNISAKRYYINCKDNGGNLIFLLPLIVNPDPMPVASVLYDEQNARVVLTMSKPHGFQIGMVLNANVVGFSPDTYNGSGFMYVLSEIEIFYNMVQDPGQVTVLGVVDYLISMTKGYFISTMIFRHGNFEINP